MDRASINDEDSMQMSSENQYEYELEIHLKEGRNLAIKDSNGSSDPYAKFALNGQSKFRSKTINHDLNPKWDEVFKINLRKLIKKTKSSKFSKRIKGKNESNYEEDDIKNLLRELDLRISVYDHDQFKKDDFIGYARIDLMSLTENMKTSLELELKSDVPVTEYLGLILMDITLIKNEPIKEYQNKENSVIKANKIENTVINSDDTQLRQEKPIKPILITSQPNKSNKLRKFVLNILLIECKNLIPKDKNGLSDPYVKFKLENQEYRSKTILKELNPKYLEQFQFYVYETDRINLEIKVMDYDLGGKDDFLGQINVDINQYDFEKTHFVKLELEQKAGDISMLITKTGISKNEMSFNQNKKFVNSFKDPRSKYMIFNNSLINSSAVGYLEVKVLGAKGLASADINGKSDPFVTLQLVNQYAQTHTEYKTLNPIWDTTFQFEVYDIHDVLEITVMDEDTNRVNDFLGKIELPILKIQNGKQKSYILKDKKSFSKAKGVIDLEMSLVFNPLKAMAVTFLNKKEESYVKTENKIKLDMLYQTAKLVQNMVQPIINFGELIEKCLNWDDYLISVFSLVAFIIFVTNFELYMVPLSVLIIFIFNYVKLRSKFTCGFDEDDKLFYLTELSVDDENDDTQYEGLKKEMLKMSLKQAKEIEETVLKLKILCDKIVSLHEKVINIFLFANSWLSFYAMILMIIAIIICYVFSFRTIILFYGINKFANKLKDKQFCSIAINEKIQVKLLSFELSMSKSLINNLIDPQVINYFSRVPNKKDLIRFRDPRLKT